MSSNPCVSLRMCSGQNSVPRCQSPALRLNVGGDGVPPPSKTIHPVWLKSRNALSSERVLSTPTRPACELGEVSPLLGDWICSFQPCGCVGAQALCVFLQGIVLRGSFGFPIIPISLLLCFCLRFAFLFKSLGWQQGLILFVCSEDFSLSLRHQASDSWISLWSGIDVLRLNFKTEEDLMLQVVDIRNKYMFAPCLTLRAVSTFTEHWNVFCGCCLACIPIKGWSF